MSKKLILFTGMALLLAGSITFYAANTSEPAPRQSQIAEKQPEVKERAVEEETFSNQINDAFEPVVAALETFLFWDPFDATGLREPIVLDDNGKVIMQDGKPKEQKIPMIVIWLMIGAVFFTIATRFGMFRYFKHAILLLFGFYDNPNDKGEISRFQALTTALSGTVGLGNIAGVAIAIQLGGPGSVLWMIIAALLGMGTKFFEGTLGIKYRIVDENGQTRGGAMYYLKQGLAKKNLKGLGIFLAGLYALLIIFGALGGGSMFQAQQTRVQFEQLIPSLENNGILIGIPMAILVAIVIIGGIKSIARVTDKIVPAMAGMYILLSLIVITIHIENMPHALEMIFGRAFAPEALTGGIIGAVIVGFQRSLFSNGAGMGDCAIAHASAKAERPVSEGFVASLEPFVDTILICTMTALVIIFTGFDEPSRALGMKGSEITTQAFGSVFHWFEYFLIMAVFLFAFSTMITWSYYGMRGFNYLVGDWFDRLFRVKGAGIRFYQIVFLFSIVVGSAVSLDAVLDFTDMMLLFMTFPNILGMIILYPEVSKELREYLADLKSGVIKRYK